MTITPCRVTIGGLTYRFVSGDVAHESTTAETAQPRDVLPAPFDGPKVWRIDAVLSRRRQLHHVTGAYTHARAWDYGKRLELSGRIRQW